MKIAFVAAWNTNSGVAMHAEPVVKALRAKGHNVKVFTFHSNDYHGEGITARDESFVTRCFGTRQGTEAFDPRPFLLNDYRVLVVEDIGMLPIHKLANIMPVIKKKAKVIQAVHENKMPDHSWFFNIDWDKVVYFDHRQDFLKKVYPDAEYIPFPCYPVRKGNKREARKRLDLPRNKKIIYSFGLRGYHSYYRELPPKLQKKAILLHLIRKEYQMLEEVSPTEWRLVRKMEALSTKEFDDYLFAADAAILHKFTSRFHAVVSSTVYQALGTGCPLFVPSQSDFFHDWGKEVYHYRDISALNKQLIKLLSDPDRDKKRWEAAKIFLKDHSPEVIAGKFEKLFREVLSK